MSPNLKGTIMTGLTRPGWAAAALSALLLVGVGALPAAARQDPGTTSVPSVSPYCPLTRIGIQFVRCDNLTGAGAPAPAWIPES
jgi:hypothetical protein